MPPSSGHLRGYRCLLGVIALLGSALAAPHQCWADLVWENHFADEQALVDGSSIVTSAGTTVTFSRTVFSDNTFGTFDLDPYRNSDYLTFEQGQLGQHRGYLEFSMDNQNNDPDDYIELALNFDEAVADLRFSILDIDSGSWDDGVEVFYNGSNNVRDNPAIAALFGSAVGLDNEPYMHGWEGLGNNAGNGQTIGNIDFDFGALQITSLRIRYFSTTDASFNPGGQIAGLSDLSFTAGTPEPSALACMCVFAGILLVGSRRRWSTRAALVGCVIGATVRGRTSRLAQPLTACADTVGLRQSC